MEYKRIEIYVWWTCNQKCTYCMEFPTMEKAWTQKVTKYEILKKLIKYKKLWYNHVTYLWGEPFIQWVFKDALLLAKKLNYTTLVTTNATTLHIDAQAQKFLPYIDELILSLEWITKEEQQLISRTKNYVHWDKVFENIRKYWKWKMLKTNIVITKDNLDNIFNMVKFAYLNWVKEISVTYPDIDDEYYTKNHILTRIMPKYEQCVPAILNIVKFCEQYDIKLKLPDFPFCIFPEKDRKKYIKLTDDFDYQTRIKLTYNWNIIDRKDLKNIENTPREREQIKKCSNCFYNNICWWPAVNYLDFFWDSEINPIKI